VKPLDHAIFEPTFACAAELGAPLLIHPQIPTSSVRNQYRPGGDARRFVDGLALSDEDKTKFACRNWERLCGA
jgi:hypothetical protein